jgi:hypothetical protein
MIKEYMSEFTNHLADPAHGTDPTPPPPLEEAP